MSFCFMPSSGLKQNYTSQTNYVPQTFSKSDLDNAKDVMCECITYTGICPDCREYFQVL